MIASEPSKDNPKEWTTIMTVTHLKQNELEITRGMHRVNPYPRTKNEVAKRKHENVQFE